MELNDSIKTIKGIGDICPGVIEKQICRREAGSP